MTPSQVGAYTRYPELTPFSVDIASTPVWALPFPSNYWFNRWGMRP